MKNSTARARGAKAGSTAEKPQAATARKSGCRFATVSGSNNIGVIPCRECRVTITSTESRDAVRGQDFAMAHLSEVAFWRSSANHSPEDFIRSVAGAVLYEKDTLIALESTANGVGSFFHREWLRAVRGESDKTPLFIPWHAIDAYRVENIDPTQVWRSLDDYERDLWRRGVTLEHLAWYHDKRKEYTFHSQMMAEFPSDHLEAFISSASGVFAPEAVTRMRRNVMEPVAVGELEGVGRRGESALKGLRFAADSRGPLRIWKFPDRPGVSPAGRYIVGVDIGGVSAGADWSVITVMDCGADPTQKPEIVATWRGHIDHDLLAWKCAAIARWYRDALLVVESNTLECEHTDGDPSSYILNQIGRCYRNLYYRYDMNGTARLPGMHINRATKSALITELVAMVRDDAYIERDELACDELEQYERRPNGSYGARDGCHDDLLMTRALIAGTLAQRRVSPVDATRRFIDN